ncbi:MAG: FkbM family methyltransferase [Gammaproteobacteria bacterium]|jgi:FkbM family methyltransferase|nr:FkbM family methyltransferase [Gammaproteobacteria bacterium]
MLKILKFLALRSSFVARRLGFVWFGLNGLDAEILKVMCKREGYFIELGANDGISQSNTKHLELFHGWKGLLIEPVPSQYRLLKFSRSKKTRKINALCVPSTHHGGVESIWDLGLMSTVEKYYEKDDLIDHIAAARKHLGREGVKLLVPALTLNEILTNVSAPKQIDLLSLDVEGMELSVLEGLDLAKWEIQFIVIESRDIVETKAYLLARGYKFLRKLSHSDLLFSR